MPESLFLSVINEGDPVVLAQEDYVAALLEVILVPESLFREKHPDGVQMPDPFFKISGNCILLRDPDPEDSNAEDIQPCMVASNIIESRLFGNPFVHGMKEYLSRINIVFGID
jgi:hypothetical protein